MGAIHQALLAINSAPGGAPSGVSIDWMTGAEHESTSIEKWIMDAPSSIQSGITDAHGRVYFTSSSLGQKRLDAHFNPISARLRFRPTTDATDVIMSFRDDTVIHVGIRRLIGGAFQVVGPSVLELAVSATGLIPIDAWYDAELTAVINDTTGSFTAKIWDDTATLLSTLSASNVDTRAGAAVIGVDVVSCGGATINSYIDNVSIDVGGNLVGRCRVETLYPTAAGDLSDWPRGGTDTGNNWDQVNEVVKDTTSYVESSAADQFDAYNIGNRSIAGTPLALQVNALARAATAGTQTFRLLLRIGGVTYEGSKTQSVTSTTLDTNCHETWSDNPATGNAWTDTEIDSVQIGYRSLTSNVRVHQACAEVLVQL